MLMKRFLPRSGVFVLSASPLECFLCLNLVLLFTSQQAGFPELSLVFVVIESVDVFPSALHHLIVCFRPARLCSSNIKRFPTFSRMLTDVHLFLANVCRMFLLSSLTDVSFLKAGFKRATQEISFYFEGGGG